MSQYRFWDMVKFSATALSYKFEQYRLSTNTTITLKIVQGALKGLKRKTVWGDEYWSFEGIPYAKPPVGELRYRSPVAPDCWEGERDCTGPAEKPLQADFFFKKFVGSEDCLYLNVFTTDISPNKARPVMVWIYGGGFQTGEATRERYSPDFFMSKDVVLVTIAYRLGAFGFLSLDDPAVDCPGNAGIKDQIMALRWVQQNISQFGGDPSNVTVFGESAGGASTHLCMLSESSKGLMHKGIVMSGSVLCPWAIPPRNDWTLRLAKALGYEGSASSADIFEFLQNCDAERIQKESASILNKEEKYNRVLVAFGPTVEPYKTSDSILTDDPLFVLKNTWSNDIPMLIGGTSFEGLFFYPEVMRRNATLNEVGDCEGLLPLDLKIDRKSTEAKNLALRIKKEYFGEDECSLKTIMKFLEIESYREFWHPIYRTVMLRLQYSTQPTYLYRFDYDSANGNAVRNLLCGRDIRGVCHGDDLCYLFRFVFSVGMSNNSTEYNVTRSMIDIWTSFAASSDPNCASLEGLKFEPVAPNQTLKCLNISEKLDFIDLPELEKIQRVWNTFYPHGKL